MAAELGREHDESVIRRLLAKDAAAVSGILRASPEAVSWTEASVKEVLQWQGAFAIATEAQGRVSGFLIARQTGEEAEILNLAVARDNRRTGKGESLLTEAANSLRALGVSRVFLEVRESNQAAISFYKKHGFSAKGRREGYYRDPAEAALVMEKNLAS